MEIKKIKEKTKELSFNYMDKLDIKKITPFGIEIEFAGANFLIVKEKLKEIFGYEPTKPEWYHCSSFTEGAYDKWILKNDGTVQTREIDNIYAKYGGEITSPIFSNKKNEWQELKILCNTLKKTERIEINGNCSIHIHTSKTIYEIVKEYVNLLKLEMLYEDVVLRFCYGEVDTPRKLLTRYAKPMSYIIYEKLEQLEKVETEEQLIKVLGYDRKYGLNLTNIPNNKKRTIERRSNNGTLNANIIQNEVWFNETYLEYAKTENFDEEFINYMIKSYEPLYINESLKEKPQKAIEFADRIYKDEIGKLYFLKQYFKTYNENDIVKTYHL